MWWCCGKTNKDAQGCKYSKHECKDIEGEEDEADRLEINKKRFEKLKCLCCKG